MNFDMAYVSSNNTFVKRLRTVVTISMMGYLHKKSM